MNLTDENALIIQIHNVKDRKILDEFLLQIIVFRCIKHDGFLYLPNNIPIYVELQNMLDSKKHFENLQVLAILSRRNDMMHQI
jgi:hypothetical protein